MNKSKEVSVLCGDCCEDCLECVIYKQAQKKKGDFLCVACNEKATEGSMRHPYCKKHFKSIFKNSQKKYRDFLERECEK